jgi:RNA polymerase sigma factor (sigma-70 family)
VNVPIGGTERLSAVPDRVVDASSSFEAFYESEYWAVVRLAAAVTSRWDVAEELVQDAFLALHRRWSQVSAYDAPDAWLRRVVLNRAVSSLRRRTAEARLATHLANQPARVVEGPQPTNEVWRLVARLPKRQAEVIALVYVEDRSVADVARILDCEESTVRTHLRRGRLALARALQLDHDDDNEDTR